MVLRWSLVAAPSNFLAASALKPFAKELYGVGANCFRNGNELSHVHPSLKRLDALNPVWRLPKLLGKLPLRKTSRFTRLAKRSDYGPLAGRIFHDTPGKLAEALLIPYHPS